MAPLTWREVSAPNFSGVAQSQQLAAQLLNNGFGALSDALGKFQGHSQNRADSAAMAEALRFTDSASLGEALRSGSILSNPSNLSADALKYIGGRQRDLINNQTHQFDLDRRQTLHNQAQDVLATQPALAKVLADARNKAISGDAAGAQALLTQNTDLLTQGGFTADQIPQLLSGEFAASERGDEHRRHQLGEQKFWENQGISKQAQDIAHSAVNNNASFEQAFRNIQNNRDIKDPRIKTQALEMLSKAAEAGAFPQADPGQQLLANLGMRYGGGTPVASAPMVSLIDRTEGAGDYSTLYSHAQRPGGAFEGVDVSRMTIGQLKEFSSPSGAYGQHQKKQLGYVATPMGRFQIVGSTLKAAAKEMGLPDDTVFDENTQNAIFHHLVNKRISGPRTMQGKIDGLRQEWEGFKSVPDDVLAQAITAYESGDQGALVGELNRNPGAGPAVRGSSQEALSLLAPRINRAVGEDPAAELASSVLVAQTEDDVLAAEAAMNSPDFAGPTGSTGTRETEEDTAESRGAGRRFLDGLMSVVAPQPANADPSSSAQNVDAALSSATGKGDRLTPVSSNEPAQPAPVDAQTALDTGILDRVFNRNGALISEVMNPERMNETPAQTAARMVGEGGLIPGGNQQAVLAAIQETIDMAGGNLAPHIAGAIVANNMESRDLRDWGYYLFGSSTDRFQTKDENVRAATRTNMDGVRRNLEELGVTGDGNVDLSRGIAQMQNQRASGAAVQELTQIQTALQSAQAAAAQALMAIQSGQDTPENRAALQQNLEMIQQLQVYLQEIAGGPHNATTIYSRSLPGLPTQ